MVPGDMRGEVGRKERGEAGREGFSREVKTAAVERRCGLEVDRGDWLGFK